MSHTRPIDQLPAPSRGAQLRLLRGLLCTPESVLDEIIATVGPVCRLGGGPLRFVILADPATVRELLLLPSDRFRWDHPLSPFPFAVGETTMLVASGDDHRRRRAAVQEAFGRRRLDRWVPTIVERTDVAIDRLLEKGHSGAPVDAAVWAKRLVIDNVVRVLFGDRLVDRTTEIEQRFQRIQDFLGSPLWRQAPHPLPFGARGAVRRDRRALDEMIDGEIAAARSATEHDPSDILAVLVARGELSDTEIRDQVKTLIGAGYDTTASSLAWIVWEATLCDGLWERLRHEASESFRDGHRVDLGALALAGRTVREGLRLHPGSGIAPRVTRDEIRLTRVTIPRATIVAWSPYLTGRDPACWCDPERFDPDRHLDGGDGAPAELAWLPFGRGPRSCIGFGLALMQLTLILSRLAQRVDLAPIAQAVPPAEGLVVSRPRGGLPALVGAA
jgi:cytochrome P450